MLDIIIKIFWNRNKNKCCFLMLSPPLHDTNGKKCSVFAVLRRKYSCGLLIYRFRTGTKSEFLLTYSLSKFFLVCILISLLLVTNFGFIKLILNNGVLWDDLFLIFFNLMPLHTYRMLYYCFFDISSSFV